MQVRLMCLFCEQSLAFHLSSLVIWFMFLLWLVGMILFLVLQEVWFLFQWILFAG